MKPLLNGLIRPTQSSFLTNRRASNNAVLVQKILHFFKTTKGRQNFMLAKIDLEKAFNRLEWSFTHDTLLYFNFPSKFVALIMSCITFSSIAILLNGSATPFFPSRGIRQGDPLFTYIFILCMERLSHRIEFTIDYGLWNLIKIATRGPPLSHLLFADDIILCTKVDSTSCIKISRIFEHFHTVSGQKISIIKSKLFFSKNTPPSAKVMAKTVLNIQEGHEFGKYLGYPIFTQHPSKHDFQYLLDNFKTRLASWKTLLLTTAGRTSLIRSTLSSLPNHAMYLSKIPNYIIKEIEA